MTISFASKIVLGGAMALVLTACGSADSSAPAGTDGATPAGIPQVDTPWTIRTDDDGAFLMQRQLNQLTLSYSLAPGSSGPKATVKAAVFPCRDGAGNELAQETFTPLADDDSQLMNVRDRFDGVVSRVSSKCRIPDEVRDGITAGFDGKYFSTDSQRAAISGS